MGPMSDCQMVSGDVITQITSLGERLYGYKNIFQQIPQINWNQGKYDGTDLTISESEVGRIPPWLSGAIATPWVNTKVPIIEKVGTGDQRKIILGNGVLLVNSVNFLQNLYNHDGEYCNGNQGKGKLLGANHSLLSGLEMSSLRMKNARVYLKIEAIGLKNMKPFECTGMNAPECRECDINGCTTSVCPTQGSRPLVLTRPMKKGDPDRPVEIKSLVLKGNPDIGFKATTTVVYGNQQCKNHRIYKHGIDTVQPKESSCSSVAAGTGTGNYINIGSQDCNDMLCSTKPCRINATSCNTHGASYNDVTVKLTTDDKTSGLVWMCQTRVTSNTIGSGPFEPLDYCEDVKFEGQSGATQTQFNGNNLTLKFNGLPDDKRFDLTAFLIDTSGNVSKPLNARWYVDASRPHAHVNVDDEDVGQPGDGGSGRLPLPQGIEAEWSLPPEGVQCNRNDVNFVGGMTDVFTHNNNRCVVTHGSHHGSGSIGSQTGTDCSGHITGIDHDVHTLSSQAHDTCGPGTGDSTSWDTDIEFTPPDQVTRWTDTQERNNLYHQIKLEKPKSKSPPQHFVILADCAKPPLKDGETNTYSPIQLAPICTTITPKGCHAPQNANVQATYYHICGRSATVLASWGAYAPEGQSCKHIPCEPANPSGVAGDGRGKRKERDLVCCRAGHGSCGAGSDRTCVNVDQYNPRNLSCAHPKGGSDQDSASQCNAPLGLFRCSYHNADCEISGVETIPKHCATGQRKGATCSKAYTGRCSGGECQYSGKSEANSDCIESCNPLDADCPSSGQRNISGSCSITLTGSCLLPQPNGSPNCKQRNRGPANGPSEYCTYRPNICKCDDPKCQDQEFKCQDGSDPDSSNKCPDMKLCQNGQIVKLTQQCTKTCQDGNSVLEHEACKKSCPDGTRILENEQCPGDPPQPPPTCQERLRNGEVQCCNEGGCCVDQPGTYCAGGVCQVCTEFICLNLGCQ